MGDGSVSLFLEQIGEHTYPLSRRGARVGWGVLPGAGGGMSAADDHGSGGNGNGRGDSNGMAPAEGVLPFRPRGEAAPGRESGVAGRHRRRRRTAPGYAPEAAPQSGEEAALPDVATLADDVAVLAAKGLSEEEIRTRLHLPAALDEALEHVLGDAFRRGQLLGRARIKEAQFEAALQGRVTAQTQVLTRLGEPQGENGGELEQDEVGPEARPAHETEAGEP